MQEALAQQLAAEAGALARAAPPRGAPPHPLLPHGAAGPGAGADGPDGWGWLAAPLGPEAVSGNQRADADALRDARRAQELLFAVQFPGAARLGARARAAGAAERMESARAACGGRRAVVNSFDRAYWGLAVNVHYLTVLLNLCLRENRTLVPNPPRAPARVPACAGAGAGWPPGTLGE